MNREDALKKIKKCLALGRAAESHEAAAAMRQAQKLMAEFNVSDHELSMVDVVEVRARATSTAMNAWEVRLARMTAEAFGCEMLTELHEGLNGAGNWARHRDYVFIGMESAPTVAGYAFEILSRQCAKARLAHIQKQPRRCKAITKTVRGDDFAKGWVAAVAGLIESFATPVRDKTLLLEYVRVKHPDLTTVKPRDITKGRKLDSGHAMAGYAAGTGAQLARGVGGMEERRLLT